jgi:hypothetical protein
MITIIRMSMIVYTAKPEIEDVGNNDQDHSRYQQPSFVLYEKLLQYQECKTKEK